MNLEALTIMQYLSLKIIRNLKAARLEVLTAVLMKIQVFWDVMPCTLLRSYQCYGEGWNHCRHSYAVQQHSS